MIELNLIIELYKIKEINKVGLYIILLLISYFIRIKLIIMFEPYKVKKVIFYNN